MGSRPAHTSRTDSGGQGFEIFRAGYVEAAGFGDGATDHA